MAEIGAATRLPLAVCLCAILCREVRAEPLLAIELVPPDELAQLVAGDRWRLYLHGAFDPESPRRLAHLLARERASGGFAYLDSPGGNLGAGLSIGRLLREHGFTTYVRRRDGATERPGACLSACVYAFVGGYFRFLTEHDTLGVHRFSSAEPTTKDLDRAQIASGAITEYLAEMGVDVGLFALTTRIRSDDIYRLPLAEARRLRVANNGALPPKWSLELLEKGLYLRGVQETVYGLGKVVFLCGEAGLVFYPFYGVSNGEELIARARAHSIRLGKEFVSIGQPLSPLAVKNGFISAPFLVPQSVVHRLKEAPSIGYGAQGLNTDLFWGFTVDVGDDRQILTKFVAQCLARNSTGKSRTDQ